MHRSTFFNKLSHYVKKTGLIVTVLQKKLKLAEIKSKDGFSKNTTRYCLYTHCMFSSEITYSNVRKKPGSQLKVEQNEQLVFLPQL